METGRFAVCDEDDIRKTIAARIPENTRKKVKWVMNIFNDWFSKWKVKRDGQKKVLKDIDQFTPNTT